MFYLLKLNIYMQLTIYCLKNKILKEYFMFKYENGYYFFNFQFNL